MDKTIEQQARESMPEWPSDVDFIAEVMPDWTTLQFPSGKAYAFNRETGRVYRLPHPDCPFAIIPSPLTLPAPSGEEVEAAAKRIAAADSGVSLEHVERLWEKFHESLRNRFRRMARAALGVGHE